LVLVNSILTSIKAWPANSWPANISYAEGTEHRNGEKDEVAQSTPTDRVSCALRRAAKAHSTVVASLLTEAGVYPGQELLLQVLWDCGPQSQAVLATTLGLDPSTVTKTLQRLERNGLIARCASKQDRRAHVVSTTAAGDALRDAIGKARAETERRAVAGLSEAEIDDLTRLLGRVAQNLCGEEPNGCPL
jgi:MarR family transcriptional regulator, organic hydroperoxide resistance regulator